MRIGLTGTIGSGKSLVANMLEELGATIIDTDVVARKAVEPGTAGYESIVKRWGGDIVGPDGKIDRKKLGAIVFDDETQRRELNGIVHPQIMQFVADELQRADPKRNIVMAVPLLFETGFDKIVEKVWVVVADPETVLRRIMQRDNLTRRNAEARVAAQMPQKEKERRADVVIRNSGGIEDTRRQVEGEWKKIEAN